MSILERIDADLKEAMKAKNEVTLSTLRMARSALKNKQIDLRVESLPEAEAESVVRTMVKQYRDALADFMNAGRQDLADKQRKEIEILETYLPAAMPAEELEAICKRIITEQNATQKDMGKIIGLIMKEAKGRADGNAVRQTVERLLSA